MTIRSNGSKRDPKRVLSSLFLLGVGLVCIFLAFRHDFKFSWLIMAGVSFFLSFAMFRSANEV